MEGQLRTPPLPRYRATAPLRTVTPNKMIAARSLIATVYNFYVNSKCFGTATLSRDIGVARNVS